MPTPTDSREPMMRRVFPRGRVTRMPLAVAVGAVVGVGLFVWATITLAPGLSPGEQAPAFVFLVGIGMVPFLVAGAFRLGRAAFLIALALACGLNAFGYVLAQDDSSSTAALAAVFLPFYSTVAVLIVAGLDGVVRRVRGEPLTDADGNPELTDRN
jgi:hypothetical protein